MTYLLLCIVSQRFWLFNECILWLFSKVISTFLFSWFPLTDIWNVKTWIQADTVANLTFFPSWTDFPVFLCWSASCLLVCSVAVLPFLAWSECSSDSEPSGGFYFPFYCHLFVVQLGEIRPKILYCNLSLIFVSVVTDLSLLAPVFTFFQLYCDYWTVFFFCNSDGFWSRESDFVMTWNTTVVKCLHNQHESCLNSISFI